MKRWDFLVLKLYTGKTRGNKMGVRCNICGCNPGPFFVWSSSRNFPREQLIKKRIKDRLYVKNIMEGQVVCYECFKRLKDEQ